METSQLSWIDTHCHLYATEFDDDRFEMVMRALSIGVNQMMMPNIDLNSLPSMLRLAEQFPGHCIPMLGLHPCSVMENYKDVLNQMKLEISKGGYSGIGETGVDLYWDTKYKKIQIEAFEIQIEWAKELGLPIIIHSRESLELNIDIIKNHQDGKLNGIFHCFGGNRDQAMRIHELGFKIGIGGIITFKKSDLFELLPQIPQDLIVLETDAPYLTPVPHRGKRNESSYLALVAEKVAQSLNVSLQDVSRITIRNAEGVFRKKG